MADRTRSTGSSGEAGDPKTADTGAETTFADFLKSRPAMEQESGHVRLRGRLLSTAMERRFVLASPDQERVFEGMATDVVSFRQLEGSDEDLVEVVVPQSAIIREIRFHNAEEIANMMWSQGSRDPGYWGSAASWKEPGYWGSVAAWKEPGYWASAASWKEPDYWGRSSWGW
jgi:hypothetical protein